MTCHHISSEWLGLVDHLLSMIRYRLLSKQSLDCIVAEYVKKLFDEKECAICRRMQWLMLSSSQPTRSVAKHFT